jgi:hypothetical protein
MSCADSAGIQQKAKYNAWPYWIIITNKINIMCSSAHFWLVTGFGLGQAKPSQTISIYDKWSALQAGKDKMLCFHYPSVAFIKFPYLFAYSNNFVFHDCRDCHFSHVWLLTGCSANYPIFSLFFIYFTLRRSCPRILNCSPCIPQKIQFICWCMLICIFDV